ncbi:hypothetical protein EVAR_20974_1 [Eumeta japonica]|uniref:Uncharacterized protein n=1 Tax=Eumeta variegata TaxID=151549 RepID=A0A4C1V4W4_EUMVA|nr:hypothetical protein EVAR_20974_1 [Eumeta japonica]
MFVPKEDLERIWKSSRRDRLRVQEDKIWENFCKEQDVVKDICQDNPYEFLENFPETYVKELRETKHLKMKQSQNAIEVGDINQGAENTPIIYFTDDLHASRVCVPQDLSEGYPLSGDEQTVEQEPVCEEILNASNETNLQSIKRNNAVKLPFGKHTQFQAQMVRMESLHHNILQALQVFHKSFEQTHCLGDNIDQLRNLMQLLRDTMTECAAIAWPTGVAAMRDIHSDIILSNCENVNVALLEHAIKTERAMNHKDTSNRRGRFFKQQLEKSRTNLKIGPSKSALGSCSGADSRLSMYSLDTLRINLTPKTKYMRGDPYRSVTSAQMKSSRTALPQRNLGYRKPNNTPISEHDKQVTSQNPRKISSKLPLMKDPQRGRPKKQIQKDKDIKTMVEQVDASPARMSKELKEGHSSRRGSLVHTPTSATSLKSLDSAMTKSTGPDIKKTSTSVGINENTLNNAQIENTKSKHPNHHSDNAAQDPLRNNTISPSQHKNEDHCRVCVFFHLLQPILSTLENLLD